MYVLSQGSVISKEFVMKAFTALFVACVSFVATAAVAGEPTPADGYQSVLATKQSTVAAAPVVVSQPATVVVAPQPVVIELAPAASPCANGRCQSAPKLYNAETCNSESCRNRLFGGTVVRKNSRTVYKPVRR
jgi:hypothetical protein